MYKYEQGHASACKGRAIFISSRYETREPPRPHGPILNSSFAWILWAIVALNALSWLVISLLPGDPGGRWLFRVQGLIWLLGVVVTATLPISKFHLIWIYPLGAMTPYAIMRWRSRQGDKVMAEIIRRHLEEQSGGEVWSWREMLRVFKVYESTLPREFAKRVNGLDGWWVAQEPGVGEVKVIRRADKVKGTLFFKDSPRFYFCWNPVHERQKIKDTLRRMIGITTNQESWDVDQCRLPGKRSNSNPITQRRGTTSAWSMATQGGRMKRRTPSTGQNLNPDLFK